MNLIYNIIKKRYFELNCPHCSTTNQYAWEYYNINIIKKKIYCNERFTCHFCLTIFIIENNTIKEFQKQYISKLPNFEEFKNYFNY